MIEILLLVIDITIKSLNGKNNCCSHCFCKLLNIKFVKNIEYFVIMKKTIGLL